MIEFYRKRIIDYKNYNLKKDEEIKVNYLSDKQIECYFDTSMLMDIEKSIRKDLKKQLKNKINL